MENALCSMAEEWIGKILYLNKKMERVVYKRVEKLVDSSNRN